MTGKLARIRPSASENRSGINLCSAQKHLPVQRLPAAIGQNRCHAHGAQIPEKSKHVTVPDDYVVNIGDGQGKACALQQGAVIPNIGERVNPRVGAAGQFAFRCQQGFPQLAQSARAGNCGKQQTVGLKARRI